MVELEHNKIDTFFSLGYGKLTSFLRLFTERWAEASVITTCAWLDTERKKIERKR